ncbi:MAG: proton extrusion protein PcxA [Pleurocapsa sp.]
MKFPNLVNISRQWLSLTPERALDAAFRAAVKIKAIEDDYFNGQIVSSEAEYSESVIKVFRSDVNNYLNTIKARMAEFKISRSLLIFSNPTPDDSTQSLVKYTNSFEEELNLSAIEKIAFIDSVVDRYKNAFSKKRNEEPPIEIDRPSSLNKQKQPKDRRLPLERGDRPIGTNNRKQVMNMETITDKTGVLPRSFMRTLNRIRQEIDPQAEDTEEEVIKKFRRSRNKTAISIRFLLILIIVPLMTHQLTKTFIITPLVERYFANHQQQVMFINKDMEEEAFMELQRYEERLHFQSLIGLAPPLSSAEEEAKIHLKAEELAEQYRHLGINAIGNIFADLFSLGAFAAIIYFCQREILIIKSFIDEIAYGLSDSAKAFLIILLTDMFVGYHSPHGWEIILEGIARHLGLPENRDFNFLFIATFPVILDTVLKYWIFRYLNRISPSSVATYKNMNE